MCPRGRAISAYDTQWTARIGMVLMLKGRYLPPVSCWASSCLLACCDFSKVLQVKLATRNWQLEVGA